MYRAISQWRVDAPGLLGAPDLLFGQAMRVSAGKRLSPPVTSGGHAAITGAGVRSWHILQAPILVKVDDPARSLDDLRSRICVVNEPDSNSGMNLLRAALAPRTQGRRFFSATHFSHSHHQSVAEVAAGSADVTAIDCVTLAHLARFAPKLIAQVRVLDWTPSSPCLPFVTSNRTSDSTVQALRTRSC